MSEPILSPEPLQHDTSRETGGPCARCGLRYARETAYVPCFVPGDTLAKWMDRNAMVLENGKMRFEPSKRKTGSI